MTNPFLHVEEENEDNNFLLGVRHGDIVHQVSTKALEPEETWWPTLSFRPAKKQEWRVLTYRRRVGTGVDCYQRVRDAALDWEFTTSGDDGDMGLLSVPSSSEIQQSPNNPPHLPHPYVAPRGRYTVSPIAQEGEEAVPFHQCIGAARRMVSFSATRVLPFFPKVYSVNPVMVVYDLVDQRGPGTTFSATAYATMKGHLLRGEERVTVALRDDNQAVDVEIVSISKAGPSMKAKGIWPFIGKMQSTFFEQHLNHLERVGTSTSHSRSIIPAASNGRRAHNPSPPRPFENDAQLVLDF
jgi:uncharacterized protein (UPF0548 family)